MEALEAQQNSLKSRAARSELLMHYLQGDQEAFNPESTKENTLLAEMVEFEGNLKILRSLNGLFSFEDDQFVQPTPPDNNAIEESEAQTQVSSREDDIKIPKEKKERLSDHAARLYLLETVFGVGNS